MQGIGMLTKPHYIKEYTMQGHPVQGLTVRCFWAEKNSVPQIRAHQG